jgi:hypothetical protein
MKKTIHSNHHLIVRLDESEPVAGLYRTRMDPESSRFNEEMRHRCEAAKRDILRHVDGLSIGSNNRVNPGAVEIKYATTYVCSFCERTWEALTRTMIGEETNPDGTCIYLEDPVDTVGLPLCCDEAQQEWRTARRKALQQASDGTE